MAVSLPGFPALERDIDVDVLIVGAGLTGVTAAYLLSQEGVRVALIDREKIASADTARTTAHLTYVTDQRIHTLAKQFGEDGARLLWHGHVRVLAQRIQRHASKAEGRRWKRGRAVISARARCLAQAI